MSDVLDAIKSRRSIRKYKSDPIPKDAIDQIIEAGLYAASGRGYQNTIMIHVSDKSMRDKIMEMNRKVGGWAEGFDPFYGAPEMIIVLAKVEPGYTNGRYDGSLVMGNLMLAAHALGIGSCWINRAREEFESEEGRAILKKLGIDSEYEGVGHCALGYIDGEIPDAAPRKENRVYYVN